MAAVHGPVLASHPSPFRSTHNASHPRVQYPVSTLPVSTLKFLNWPFSGTLGQTSLDTAHLE